MLEGFPVLLFLSIALVTVLVSLSFGRRSQAVERIAPRGEHPSSFLPSSALAWRELVGKIGAFIPSSAKDLPVLKRRLIRAGFRHPNASRLFFGIRALAAVLGALVALLVGFRIAADNMVVTVAIGLGIGYLLPMQILMIRIRRRQRAIEKGLPNALDLMVVCVESGLGMDQTAIQVARELHQAHPEICDELAVMNLEMRAGKARAEALHNLASRTGVDDLKKLVAVLVQTDRFGTSIAASLRSHSEYMRTMARQRAEEAASKLPVKLVFPIFFCVLPSLFVVTLGPVMTQIVRELVPMIENM